MAQEGTGSTHIKYTTSAVTFQVSRTVLLLRYTSLSSGVLFMSIVWESSWYGDESFGVFYIIKIGGLSEICIW